MEKKPTFFRISAEEYNRRYGQEQPLLMLPIQEEEDVPYIRRRVDSFLQERIKGWQNPRRQRILLALSEAVTNVVKHTPGGRVLLYLEKESPRLHVIDEGGGLPFADNPAQLLEQGFSSSGSMGAGFSVMLQYLNLLVVCTSNRGTKLVLYTG